MTQLSLVIFYWQTKNNLFVISLPFLVLRYVFFFAMFIGWEKKINNNKTLLLQCEFKSIWKHTNFHLVWNNYIPGHVNYSNVIVPIMWTHYINNTKCKAQLALVFGTYPNRHKNWTPIVSIWSSNPTYFINQSVSRLPVPEAMQPNITPNIYNSIFIY